MIFVNDGNKNFLTNFSDSADGKDDVLNVISTVGIVNGIIGIK